MHRATGYHPGPLPVLVVRSRPAGRAASLARAAAAAARARGLEDFPLLRMDQGEHRCRSGSGMVATITRSGETALGGVG